MSGKSERDAGFDALQGYYYSKPLPEAEFVEYLGQ
jgi:EAL domain-containing protein (putative c-di-GMP-specific phosphodiesterase class I)